MTDWIEIPVSSGAVAKIDEADWHIFLFGRWTLGGGTTDGSRYLMQRAMVDGQRRTVYLHRLIAKAPDGMQVDHINRDKLDNRRANLRIVSASQNHQNRSDAHSNTGVRGVNFHTRAGRYRASITLDRRHIHLGYYDTVEEAAAAYAEARTRYHTHAPNDWQPY